MQTFRFLSAAIIVLPLLMSACTDSTTEPTVNLGETTLEEFYENPGYMAWFEPIYNTYPSEDVDGFNAAVARISNQLASEENDYTMVMVLKPNCGCQHTQREMPRVMKTLDEAGFPHEDIQLWVTDRPLNGIDEIKDTYNITVAPTFLVLKDGAEMGRIEVEEASEGSGISTDLASIFDQ